MKLELPNRVALYLWENEVETIHLQDSQIVVQRPSGQVLRISLSFWRRNVDSGKTSIPSQSATNSEVFAEKLSLTLPSNTKEDSSAALSASRSSLQKILSDLKRVVEDSSRDLENNQIKIESLKKDLDVRLTALEESISQESTQRKLNFRMWEEIIMY